MGFILAILGFLILLGVFFSYIIFYVVSATVLFFIASLIYFFTVKETEEIIFSRVLLVLSSIAVITVTTGIVFLFK